MTAQIEDNFRYKNKTFALAGIKGKEPFNPGKLGFSPVGSSAACYRGYLCEYSVNTEEKLILSNLYLSLYKTAGPEWIPDIGKPVNGIHPKKKTENSPPFLNNCYEGIDLPLTFTGGMLLGRGFIRELYIHMGFHPAWKYREVLELNFENGLLVSENDRSAEMEDYRSSIPEDQLRLDRGASVEEIRDFISRSFLREYQ